MRRGAMKKNGFTLLELIIVIIVIAILASIALPQYNIAVEKARATEAVLILGAMRGAQLRYYQQWGMGTSDENLLDCDIPTPQFFKSPNTVWWYATAPKCAGPLIVVTIERTTLYQADPYVLYMDIDGNITCYRFYGFDICSRLGFKACD